MRRSAEGDSSFVGVTRRVKGVTVGEKGSDIRERKWQNRKSNEGREKRKRSDKKGEGVVESISGMIALVE
ncbi:MAG: hypothetical protein AAF620_07425 [Bacteroidota bacterium]